MGKTLDKNILVISDLHLGEDLRPGGANVSYLRHLVKLERELENFLAHYTAASSRRAAVAPGGQRRHGRLHVGDDPARRARPEEGDDDEDRALRSRLRRAPVAEEAGARDRAPPGRVRRARPSSSPPATSWSSSSATTTSSSTTRRCSARWSSGCAAWPSASGADEERAPPSPRASQFCPWFYYQEDLIYIEHGHQYDEYCSFDYLLHPVAPNRSAG